MLFGPVLSVVLAVVATAPAAAEDCWPLCTQIIDEEDFDLSCNETCKISKCQQGCDLWDPSSDLTCQKLCEKNDDSERWVLYCTMGCNLAVSHNLQRLEATLGVPGAPYLVADSRRHDSLELQWPPSPSDLTPPPRFLVQWRYEEASGTRPWEYYRPEEPLISPKALIEGLHPYTKYRFRVAWLLLPSANPLYSDESIPISTQASGVPATSPTITSLTAVGPTRVAVSWSPPDFPNGPVVSYVLYLREMGSENVVIKDLEASKPEDLYFMFTNLRPNKTYSLSVGARNLAGEGPTHVRQVTTPARPDGTVGPQSPPHLVIASPDSVLMQSLSILDDPFTVFHPLNTSIQIRGVSLHVKQQAVFVSDSTGRVLRVPIQDPRHSIEPLAVAGTGLSQPSRLAVDWLNNHLYVGEPSSIARCRLPSSRCEVVVSGFETPPSDLQVDPCNGYLFWATKNGSKGGGLYRLDLDRIQSRVVPQQEAQLVARHSGLEAFAVDHRNFRLLVPRGNTVVSLALDGSDAADIRANSQAPQFAAVTSLASHSGLFYWTTASGEVFGEEAHSGKFYHNAYLLGKGLFFDIDVLHPEDQPHPIPHNPVEEVQAIFLEDTAKITWSRPRLLGGLGRGAWQNWLYEVSLFDPKAALTIYSHNISGTAHTLTDLSPGTLYTLRVRAYTTGGRGPWSPDFTGSTLRPKAKDAPEPYLLWTGTEGLLRSDLVGEGLEPVLHSQVALSGLTWHSDGRLILATPEGSVLGLEGPRRGPSRLANITQVSALAIDWMAPKLYWASPLQQTISRCGLDGSAPETLPVVTLAPRQMTVDSPASTLYWVTAHSLECSRLNGDHHRAYFRTGLFSGKYVMGVTLNLDGGWVYWMIRSAEGSTLYRAPLAQNVQGPLETSVQRVGRLPADRDLQGPLFYFSNRLFWAGGEGAPLISDLNGTNVASLQGLGLRPLRCLGVVDPSLQPYPDGLSASTIRVVPEAVSQLQAEGTWANFSLVWPAVLNTNFGKVFYELKLESRPTVVTSDTSYPYPDQLSPHSLLGVAMRAFTYWGSSRQVFFQVHTPMSTPSQPLRPRGFATFAPPDIDLEFRWDPPARPNGPLSGYRLTCWLFLDGVAIPVCGGQASGILLGPDVTRHVLLGQLPNNTYHFQVQAFTTVGAGPRSEEVLITTYREHSVPQLALARGPLGVSLLDVDSGSITDLVPKAIGALSLSLLTRERRLFWLEDNGSLLECGFDGTNLTSLGRVDLPSSPSMAVDWVGRRVYWTARALGSELWRLDLATGRRAMIYRTPHPIGAILVHPASGTLVLTLLNLGDETKGSLVALDLEGQGERPLMSTGCGCDRGPAVVGGAGRAVTLSPGGTLVWAEARQGHLWSMDLQGCKCQLRWNSSLEASSMPLAMNGRTIYWADKDSLFWTSGPTDHPTLDNLTLPGIEAMVLFGRHAQPYPDPACLMPLPYSNAPSLLHRTCTSLVLRLEIAERPRHCKSSSFASVKYTIHYGPTLTSNCSVNISECLSMSTYNQTMTLEPLLSFTNYTLRVSASTHFGPPELPWPSTGPRLVVRTREGVPSPPLDISAKAITPRQVEVRWRKPASPNGEGIWYEVRWRSEHHRGGPQGHQVVLGGATDPATGHLIATINAMPSNASFEVWVRALSEHGDLHSDSERVIVTMPELPDGLSLIDSGPSWLSLSWTAPHGDLVVSHSLEYTRLGESQWLKATPQPLPTVGGTQYNFTIRDLRPVTRYAVRMLLTYKTSTAKFVWPQDLSMIFPTRPDRPGSPGVPSVREVASGVYQVVWQEAADHGGDMLLYELQCRTLDDEGTEDHILEEVWNTVQNDSESHWVVSGLRDNHNYAFRVRALNELGSSEYVPSAEPFFLPALHASLMESGSQSLGLILAASLCSLVLVIALMVLAYYLVHKRRELDKKSPGVQYLDPPPDLELATLRELPLHGNFVHQNNVLYAISDLPTDEELAVLPHISRDQIVLTKFLGSGAFGEVFEGLANDLDGDGTPPTRVAVKTLRKGAKEQEKAEFLKEAKLMSHFQHEHILRMLGICLDNNPNFLILELMEGGDLLTFLRAHRPQLVGAGSRLDLVELTSICADVARGGRYLEELHFVHRDLAARNCLVSEPIPGRRLVKIGDFGLARDVYKHDYYRKEGEGMLPVRWMAPESLIDGVFTCQSDIWSFGVLLWEVMTLGQQPYPARSNPEVLQFICNGGRPEAPPNCPEIMHDLMTRCWNYFPSDRPTFAYCLEKLEDYAPQEPNMVHNQSYLVTRQQKRNVDSLSTASLSSQEDGPSRYLEILGDTQDADGYEIPKLPPNIIAASPSPSQVVLLPPSSPAPEEKRPEDSPNPQEAPGTSTEQTGGPPPSYSQVVRNGYLSMTSLPPVIASALRKSPWPPAAVEIPYFPNSSLC